MRPLRLTSRPGRASRRVRMVRVTVSWSSGWTPPRRAVQRMRLWASTAQAEPGGVGEEPSGRAVLEAGAFFEVADGELDGGVVAVELVDRDGGRSRLVMNAW